MKCEGTLHTLNVSSILVSTSPMSKYHAVSVSVYLPGSCLFFADGWTSTNLWLHWSLPYPIMLYQQKLVNVCTYWSHSFPASYKFRWSRSTVLQTAIDFMSCCFDWWSEHWYDEYLCCYSQYYNYQNLLSDVNLIQHVTDPSRKNSSLIYHIDCEYVTMYTLAILVLSVKQVIGLSGHHVQIVQTLTLCCSAGSHDQLVQIVLCFSFLFEDAWH